MNVKLRRPLIAFSGVAAMIVGLVGVTEASGFPFPFNIFLIVIDDRGGHGRPRVRRCRGCLGDEAGDAIVRDLVLGPLTPTLARRSA